MSVSKQAINKALSQVYDPDLGQSIVKLGFVKDIDIQDGAVSLSIELTSPACPVKDALKAEAEEAIRSLPGVQRVAITMTARSPKAAQPVEKSGLAAVGNLIAVASGKGGVGKSTVAASIARELANRGYAVGLLDVDLYGPSIPTLFEHHEVGLSGDGNEMVVPEDFDGLKVMSFGFWLGEQPAIMRGPMVSNYVTQFLHQVNWGTLDYLFLDLPPGTGDVQITLTQSARIDGAVIVTTPHVLSAADVGKAVRMFDRVSVPILGVVENMSYFVAPDTGARYEVFGSGAGRRISEQFGLPILGNLPLSAEEYGGPIRTNPHTNEVRQAVDEMVRSLGRARVGVSVPDVTTDENSLTLRYADGEKVSVDFCTLRAGCGCAVCVDEFSGEQKLDPASIPKDIHPESVGQIGNYALSIKWSDGHDTGFFPYRRIKELAGV